MGDEEQEHYPIAPAVCVCGDDFPHLTGTVNALARAETGARPPQMAAGGRVRPSAHQTYDSRADTLTHSLRVGALLAEVMHEMVYRMVHHDLSKTREPELSTFNEFTPKLQRSTYGSDEYKANLAAMGEGLEHHYASNRHHPEHFERGVLGMTLVDLMEMLADWTAAVERNPGGDLANSLAIQQNRFQISPDLMEILRNTAVFYGWLPAEGGQQ